MEPNRPTWFPSVPFNNLPGAGAEPWSRERLEQEFRNRGLPIPTSDEPEYPVANDDDSDSDMNETYDFPLESDGPSAAPAPQASREQSAILDEVASTVDSISLVHTRRLVSNLIDHIRMQLNLIITFTARVIELEHVLLNQPHRPVEECQVTLPPPAVTTATPPPPAPPLPSQPQT